jgi:Ca2+-binding EF-hand superfamily protein
VRIFDKNGDGELSFKELFGRENEKNMKKYSAEFKMADQNEDGKLDVEVSGLQV